jgi:hypothetical protein
LRPPQVLKIKKRKNTACFSPAPPQQVEVVEGRKEKKGKNKARQGIFELIFFYLFISMMHFGFGDSIRTIFNRFVFKHFLLSYNTWS